MSEREAIEVLTQRRDYLIERIKGKLKVGWDVEYDTREREALTVIIDAYEDARRR